MAYNAASYRPRGFKSGLLSTFTGTPGIATIETGEIETAPGQRMLSTGVKPLVDAAAVTLAIGYRDDLSASVTYTSETTVTARTGFADFRINAKYQRVRVKITGAFTAAQGVEPAGAPCGI